MNAQPHTDPTPAQRIGLQPLTHKAALYNYLSGYGDRTAKECTEAMKGSEIFHLEHALRNKQVRTALAQLSNQGLIVADGEFPAHYSVVATAPVVAPAPKEPPAPEAAPADLTPPAAAEPPVTAEQEPVDAGAPVSDQEHWSEDGEAPAPVPSPYAPHPTDPDDPHLAPTQARPAAPWRPAPQSDWLKDRAMEMVAAVLDHLAKDAAGPDHVDDILDWLSESADCISLRARKLDAAPERAGGTD